MLRVMVHGSGFGKNFGDILISDYLVSHLRCWFPDVELLSIGMDEEFASSLGLTSVSPAEALDTADAWILGPGGYLSEPGSSRIRWHVRNYSRHRDALGAFSRGSGPKAIFGASVGPLRPSPFSWLVRDALRAAGFVAVRDRVSFEYCQYRRLHRAVARLMPDVAFDSEWLANQVRHRTIERDRPFSVILHAETTSEFSILIGALRMAAADDRISQGDLKILLLSDNAASTFSQLSGADLIRQVQEVGFRTPLTADFRAVSETLSLINGASLVVTTKLHVGLTALSLGVSAVFAPKHPKVARLLRVVGAEEMVAKLDASVLSSTIAAAIGAAPSNCYVGHGAGQQVRAGLADLRTFLGEARR